MIFMGLTPNHSIAQSVNSEFSGPVRVANVGAWTLLIEGEVQHLPCLPLDTLFPSWYTVQARRMWLIL